MIDVAAILTASVVCLAGVMSPGPNSLAIIHRAVTAPRAEALALVGGVVCTNALWSSAALFGLGVLFALFPWLFWSAKLLGAVYLIWFGLRLIRRSSAPLAARPTFAAPLSFFLAFRDGVVTNLSNPKAMVFYASVFSTAVPTGATPATLATMVLMVAVISGLWYGGVALFLSTERAARVYRRAKTLIERSCGALLILFGLRQAVSRS
jgi:threonine/homoserine/homoserine lactone efflux protein